MGANCCICSDRKSGKRRLTRAQTMTKTSRGKRVSTVVLTQFYTLEELTRFKEVLNKTDKRWTELFDKPFNELSQISGNLYLSGVTAVYEENIRTKGIKCLIEVTFETAKYEVPAIKYYRIPVEDSEYEDLYQYFDEVSDLINENDKKEIKTIVFCMAGVSRSATVVIAYLMKYWKYTLREALSHVKTRRPVVEPNINFIHQLIKYEKKLYKKNYFKWVEGTRGGVRMRVPDFYFDFYGTKPSDLTKTSTDSDSEGTKRTEMTTSSSSNIDRSLSQTYQKISKDSADFPI